MNRSIKTTNIVISKAGFFDSLISFVGHDSKEAKTHYFKLYADSVDWEPEEEDFELLLDEGYFENEDKDRYELHNSIDESTSA